MQSYHAVLCYTNIIEIPLQLEDKTAVQFRWNVFTIMQRIAFPTSNNWPSKNQELKLKTKHVLELLNLKKNPAPFNIPM